MLEEISSQELGSAADWLIKAVEERALDLFDELLSGAVALWTSAAFSRFNDDEVCCTVRLYACALEVAKSQSKYALVRVTYDSVVPTPDMLTGNAHPNSSVRPDLLFTIGRLELFVEAKRLAKKSPLPRKYVTDGMSRFTTGYYVQSLGYPAQMLGYVVADDTSSIVAKINVAIAQHLPNHSKLEFEDVSSAMTTYKTNDAASGPMVHRLLDLHAGVAS